MNSKAKIPEAKKIQPKRSNKNELKVEKVVYPFTDLEGHSWADLLSLKAMWVDKTIRGIRCLSE